MPLMPEAQAQAQPTTAPPHWGEDPLTQFIQIGATAGWGAFALPDTRPYVERLIAIDRTFISAMDALGGANPEFFKGLMLVSAHAAFRSSAQFAMEGRTCEAMVLLRSCLEYALYGVQFHRRPELIEVWSRRGDGDAQRKAVKKNFKNNEMMNGIAALNNAIGERFKHFYELTIDMGAHPNELGFYGRLNIQELPNGNRQFNVRYLQGGNATHLAVLKNACQIGVCTLECFWLVYRERFDIMGVKATVDELKQGL